MTNWILYIDNFDNFIRSSKFNIFGINGKSSLNTDILLKEAKPKDLLWFWVLNENNKPHIVGVAKYKGYQNRELGPLIDISLSNEELGWENIPNNYDIEIHYSKLYNLYDCKILNIPSNTYQDNTLKWKPENKREITKSTR